MINQGKKNVLGVLVDAVDYRAAVTGVVQAAKHKRPYALTALAVHGVMTGVGDPEHRYRLNQFDMVTPDGQPVRWALNLLHGVGLKQRVYGPNLTLEVCRAAAAEGLPVYFYGSKPEVLESLTRRLKEQFPSLKIAGAEPSKFRQTTFEEKVEIAQKIKKSGARIVFVGLGCPRQEVFAYEYRNLIGLPLLAVGAAFDYHAGLVDEPPLWMQNAGLQWLYRLTQQPSRLWQRYVLLNPAYLALLLAQWLRLWHPNPERGVTPPSAEKRFG
ncbi:MAG: WecB/TagA/CpsF family glycosyltransferase [Meiothermus sp.]|nr:WecB/TagA/CpsF family glycosyltransferase [Meiothermus sp.]